MKLNCLNMRASFGQSLMLLLGAKPARTDASWLWMLAKRICSSAIVKRTSCGYTAPQCRSEGSRSYGLYTYQAAPQLCSCAVRQGIEKPGASVSATLHLCPHLSLRAFHSPSSHEPDLVKPPVWRAKDLPGVHPRCRRCAGSCGMQGGGVEHVRVLDFDGHRRGIRSRVRTLALLTRMLG
jgi:hypothetical protein